ncbi:F-box/LRR-repeat protein 4-like [Aphidius gifuensis]|uniref:F-box/LRR-repeat protein 4-like n=1 Tax=Aphidius gifuensis TaxID=684658 RepID=UPI001CDC2030|nr:F-box/LRR-repeat protein 4-like [Aphidius gifuensis]
MPIIGECCKNLTRLNFIYNEQLEIHTNHYIHAFKNLDKLTIIKINVMNMGNCYNTKFQPHIINYLPEGMNKIYLDYDKEEFMSPVLFNIRKFKKLQYLSLKGCLLDDIIQGISETTTLVELSLIDCFVSENCLYNPVEIFNQFVNLEYININNRWGIKTPNILNNILNSSKSIIHCNIMLLPNWNAPDISIKNWDNLLNLEHLGTRWRINDNTAIKLVKYCKNLESLDIGSKVITETALQKLTELKNLDYLYYCFAGGVRNESMNTIVTISNWKKLEHLHLLNEKHDDVIDDNIIGPVPPAVVFDELSKLQYLESLRLLNIHNFPDSSIIAIANSCKNLQKLEMIACVNITEAALMSIISLEKLEELSVSNMDGVTDNFISKLKGLKKLECRYCKNITDAGIIEFIKNCPNLHTLCLFGCNITIETFTGADEITKNRINNIALCITYEKFPVAPTLKIESNWLVVFPLVKENVK